MTLDFFVKVELFIGSALTFMKLPLQGVRVVFRGWMCKEEVRTLLCPMYEKAQQWAEG